MKEESGFNSSLEDVLKKPLDRSKIKTLEHGSKAEYITGYQVIEDANKTFGFGEWQAETVYNREISRQEVKIGKQQKDGYKVGYEAKVRINVKGVVREGTGAGSGTFKDLFDCIESAAKEAETDALKRAFRTFGNMFGLALYDKEKKQVGDVEIYDNQLAAAEIILSELESAFTECKTIDDVQTVWTKNVKDVVKVKQFDDLYTKLLTTKNNIKKRVSNAGS